ncbi:hypothetical protein P8452_50914 [Trifolium repens]|nr:hypothetical protein P8452_50914 [Trifolium repens]
MLTSLCHVRFYSEDKNGTLPNGLEEKTMSLWKKSKQFRRHHQDYYHSEEEFDSIDSKYMHAWLVFLEEMHAEKFDTETECRDETNDQIVFEE